MNINEAKKKAAQEMHQSSFEDVANWASYDLQNVTNRAMQIYARYWAIAFANWLSYVQVGGLSIEQLFEKFIAECVAPINEAESNGKFWQIIPHTHPDCDRLKPKRIEFTYLHGQLQMDCGYDVYGFVNCSLPTADSESEYIQHDKLNNGMYPCTFKGHLCTLFFWHDNTGKPRGLVTYNTDIPAFEHAKKMLSLKSSTL